MAGALGMKIALFLSVLLLSGCFRPVKIDQVPGLYHANKKEFGTLSVDTNGKYTYVFIQNGVTMKNSGDWKPDTKSGEPAIAFSKFKWPQSFSESNDGADSGIWIVQVERKWNHLRLVIDPDLGVYFEK
jgi:hypothetical protein